MRALLLLAATTAILALSATSASATFDSCSYNGATKTVTATFGSGTTGELRRGASGTIEADGVSCGGTVSTTDLITVVGDADPEAITLRLDGGPFAPGATDEPGASDEIELDVQLGGLSNLVRVVGSSGVEIITIGVIGGPADYGVNLNAAEADGKDRDMVVGSAGTSVVIDGAGGNDVLSDTGGPGATVPVTGRNVELIGNAGNDAVTVNGTAAAGPGNDTFTFPSPGTGALSYVNAFGPVTLTLTSAAGGATATGGDGWGGTDTIVGEAGPLTLTPFDDHATALSDARLDIASADQGDDTLTGAARADSLAGTGGNDTIDGGGGADTIDAGPGDDVIQARDATTDTIDCGPGSDTLTADAQDVLTACELVDLPPPAPTPTNPDPTPPAPTPTTPATATPSITIDPGPTTGKPPVTTPPPSVSSLVERPATSRCVSHRRVRLRVKRTAANRIRSITITVNGKRKLRVSGRKLRESIDLHGLPKGRFTVRLDVVLTDGGTVKDTRAYRACATKQR